MTTVTRHERGFTLVRQLDAPRELVFQAWTDPEHLRWFLGPGRTDIPTTVDLRVGGAWRLHMAENTERKYMTGGIYREIVPPEKLVFTWGAVDGWPLIDPDHPEESPVVTIILNESGGGTEMVFHVAFDDSLSDEQIERYLATGMIAGWTETLARLMTVPTIPAS